MNRFFVFEKKDNYFVLSKETLNHLKVIRTKNKPFICVYEQEFYLCMQENNLAKIIEKLPGNHEQDFEVVLAMSIIKLDRFEWLLQKATELGVTKIIPIHTRYCDGDLVKYKFEKKIERFRSILQNAAEQSFRNKVPSFERIHTFEEVLSLNINQKFLAHEKINTSLQLENKIDHDVLFLVGPEGGFSEEEIALAQEQDVQLVSLGSRILRAETAAIYLLSQIKMK